jgi:tripartite-type tricarboxylate transporter receptor subunit TctC
VVNVPGGGSIVGANAFMLNRPADGLHILASAGSTHIPYLLRKPAVRYDFTKLTPLISLPMGAVIYVSPRTGYREPRDLLRPAQPLVYAGISATGLDLVMLLVWEILGIHVHSVMGFEGRAAARLAFERGESNIDFQLIAAYRRHVEPMVAAGRAIPVATLGMIKDGRLVRDPSYPNLPTVGELHVAMYGREPSGPAWEAYKALITSVVDTAKPYWIHANAPPEAVRALREAFAAMIKDPEFLEKGAEEIGDYDPLVGEELVRLAAGMHVSDSVLAWVRRYLSGKYGITW